MSENPPRDIAQETPNLDALDPEKGAVVGKGPELVSPLDPDLPRQSAGESAEEFISVLNGRKASGIVDNTAEEQETILSFEERKEKWRQGVVEALKQLPFRPEEAVGGIELQAVVRKIQELGFATEKDATMHGFEASIAEIIKDLVRQKKTG